MFRCEVGVGERSVHFGIRSRDGKSDTSQHVICGNPVDMVLIDLGSDNHSVLVLIVLPFPLTGALLSYGLGPSEGVLILHNIFRHVGVYALCVPSI